MSTTISPEVTGPSATHAVIAAVLRQAARLITRDGWRADNPADYSPHAELTADEAIGDAARYAFNRISGTDTAARMRGAYVTILGSLDYDEFTAAVLDAFAGFLVMTGQADPSYCTWSGRYLVGEFNDAEGRTGGQVLAALAQCADVLEVIAALGPLEGGEAA